MSDLAFCTLTYGEKYRKFSHDLIKQVLSFNKPIYILTDYVEEYENYSKEYVKVFRYTLDHFNFHEKRVIVEECLKENDAAFFLDADVHIMGCENLNFLDNLNPGLHIFDSFGTIKDSFLNDDNPPIWLCDNPQARNTKYGQLGLNFLKEHNLKTKIDYHHTGIEDDYLGHFLEGRWILKKQNGLEQNFLKTWKMLSDFTNPIDRKLGYTHCMGAGEGAHMSIAGYNSGIDVFSPSPISYFIRSYFISNYIQKTTGDKPWNIAG